MRLKKAKITATDFDLELLNFAEKIQKGNFSQRMRGQYGDLPGKICTAFNAIADNLERLRKKNAEHEWLQARLAEFAALAQGEKNLQIVAQFFLSALVPALAAQCGVLYAYNNPVTDQALTLQASYGLGANDTLQMKFRPGESLIGQCAQDKKRILLTRVPDNYRKIYSGMGESSPANIVIVPVIFAQTVLAVIELGTLGGFSETHLALLDELALRFGIVINGISSMLRAERLLNEAQSLAEKLKIADAALAQISKYKSEFLATMSHELRTPLSSLLVLSQKLAENASGNLSPKQTTYSEAIHSSAEDLMNLINDILDLSKIEAGKMVVENSQVLFTDIKNFVERNFGQIAANKMLAFEVTLAADLPETIHTDEKKLQQILRNLLANAFKFTEQGSVTLAISSDANAADRITFGISDTGIGVATHLKTSIFEAFAQGDNSTRRKYSGTGLGLSISRELATLLGGEIHIADKNSPGADFTLVLPNSIRQQNRGLPGPLKKAARAEGLTATVAITETEFFPPDDQQNLNVGDTVLLMIEDDLFIVGTFLDLAHELGYKGIVATTGASGLKLTELHQPDMIILDLDLADAWGWVVLDKLKRHPASRSIPVGVICGGQKTHRALQFAVKAHMRRPANRPELASMMNRLTLFNNNPKKRLLIIGNSDNTTEKLMDIVFHNDIEIASVHSWESGIQLAKEKSAALIVVDFDGSEASVQFVKALKSIPELKTTPVIIYNEKGCSAAQKADFIKLSDSAAIQEAASPEKLLEYSVLFLHRIEANLTEAQQVILRRLAEDKTALKNKSIMIVDDDSRNIIAISAILEDLEMKIFYAGAGKEAIEHLKSNPDIDLVLMDIMMPDIDGFETTRQIRCEREFESLPIIAVTARVMAGDREKCLQAGASDFLPKPINMEQLIAILRIWLS